MAARSIPGTRLLNAIIVLGLATAVCMGMLGSRMMLGGNAQLSFLPWNLLLAWVPLAAAATSHRMRLRGANARLLFCFCVLVWFLFYPNAPYLITDLLHLRERPPTPLLYDVIVLMSFAWTGLCCGNLSLYLMHDGVRRWRGQTAGWLFTGTMLVLGTFGVYMGRFWRWNSWDAVSQPRQLTAQVLQNLHGISSVESLAFCIPFLGVSFIIYLTLFSFAQLHTEPAAPAKIAEEPEALPEKPIAAGNALG